MVDLYDLSKYVQGKVPQYANDINKCYNDKGQLRCQHPQVLLGRNDYSIVPRYAAIVDELRVPMAGRPPGTLSREIRNFWSFVSAGPPWVRKYRMVCWPVKPPLLAID